MADMTTQTMHFLLTPDGGVRQFSAEQAARVAAGAGLLPEFAKKRVRYIQVTVKDESETEVKVQAAGACIEFSDQVRLTSAGPPATETEQITRFEYDACVQWALKDVPAASPTLH